MPDNDIVPGGVRRLWLRAAQMLIAGQPPNLVATQIERTLATELTRQQLPTTLPLVKGLRESMVFSDTAAAEQALNDYRIASGAQPLAQAVHDAATVFTELHRRELVEAPPADVARAVTEDALRRFVNERLCGPDSVTEQMQCDGRTLSEIAAHTSACLDHVQYAPLADAVLRENVRVTAPRREKLSQADLLDLEVE